MPRRPLDRESESSGCRAQRCHGRSPSVPKKEILLECALRFLDYKYRARGVRALSDVLAPDPTRSQHAHAHTIAAGVPADSPQPVPAALWARIVSLGMRMCFFLPSSFPSVMLDRRRRPHLQTAGRPLEAGLPAAVVGPSRDVAPHTPLAWRLSVRARACMRRRAP